MASVVARLLPTPLMAVSGRQPSFGALQTLKMPAFTVTCSHVFRPKPIPTQMMKLLRPTHRQPVSYGWYLTSAKAPDKEVITEAEIRDSESIDQTKQALFASLQGINRGIFGVPSEKKTEIDKLVGILESQTPTPEPTLCPEKLGGAWKLIYGTVVILGSKRTKLGLRDFITLGDLFQYIDVAEGKAVNVIKFSARGLNLLSGELRIDASFKISSKSRVDISLNKSEITPDQLMNVFSKNYDLLLGIFNPEGWLEITFVDESLRIGRDDKGNIFILQRADDFPPNK